MVAAKGSLRAQRVRLNGVWLDARLGNTPAFAAAAKAGARGAMLWGPSAARDRGFDDYVKAAAAAFAPLYAETAGAAGFVTVPQPPCLACAADKIDGEASALFRDAGASNVMSEIVLGDEALKAVRSLAAAGLPLCAVAPTRARAQRAVESYLKGLEARADKDLDAGAAALALKIPVGAIDGHMNPLLERRMAAAPIESIRAAYRVLIGRVGVSTAKMVRRDLQRTLNSARWELLKGRGAREPFLIFALTPAAREAPAQTAELLGERAYPSLRPSAVAAWAHKPATIDDDAGDAKFKLDKLANYQIDLDNLEDAIFDAEDRFLAAAEKYEDLA